MQVKIGGNMTLYNYKLAQLKLAYKKVKFKNAYYGNISLLFLSKQLILRHKFIISSKQVLIVPKKEYL